MQYCAKPMFGRVLALSGGQSGVQPLEEPKPYQPQNQPSCEAPLSRIITAAPLTGNSFSGSAWRQGEAGAGYISLTITAPSGIAGELAGPAPAAGRLVRSQAAISGEYQIITGACVPKALPCRPPSTSVAVN